MCSLILLLTQMIFFREIHVYLQLRWKGLFGTNIVYHRIEIPKLQEVSISKTNSFLTGNLYCKFSCFYHKWVSLERYMCLFQLSWIGLLGSKTVYLHLKKSKFQEVSKQLILTWNQCDWFSSCLHKWYSFVRYTCIFNSAQKAYLEQPSLPPPWESYLAGYIPFKI
jgi:hypothetical protein